MEGIRVLDLSQYLPGPFGTRLLSDMGADVIKVEPPAGDPLRSLNPVTGSADGVPFWKTCNAGKSVLRLDLKKDEDKSVLSELLKSADVLFESYRPGVLERLGFGRQKLGELNPGLVHLALTGYGQTGPKSSDGGHDLNYIALTGALSVSGTNQTPVINWPPADDLSAAQQAVIAIQGALLRRTRNGQGAYIDLSMSDVYLSWQDWGLTSALNGGGISRGACLLGGGAACYQVYATSDARHIALGALEPKFWENFCRAVDHPEWITRQGEDLPQTDLVSDVATLIGHQTLNHWDHLLSEADCCYQAVLTYEEAATSPQAEARGLISRFEDRTEVLFPALTDGKAPTPRVPVREIDVSQALERWT